MEPLGVVSAKEILPTFPLLNDRIAGASQKLGGICVAVTEKGDPHAHHFQLFRNGRRRYCISRNSCGD
jgi:hypothetical protein